MEGVLVTLVIFVIAATIVQTVLFYGLFSKSNMLDKEFSDLQKLVDRADTNLRNLREKTSFISAEIEIMKNPSEARVVYVHGDDGHCETYGPTHRSKIVELDYGDNGRRFRAVLAENEAKTEMFQKMNAGAVNIKPTHKGKVVDSAHVQTKK